VDRKVQFDVFRVTKPALLTSRLDSKSPAPLNQLALTRRGFHVIGPTVRGGAIVYDTPARTFQDLPFG
jgi:hypothetical protein